MALSFSKAALKKRHAKFLALAEEYRASGDLANASRFEEAAKDCLYFIERNKEVYRGRSAEHMARIRLLRKDT